MSDKIEEEITRALAAEALAYEPPDHLVGETLAAAEEAGNPGPLARMRGWLESRRLRRRAETPRWAFAGMALAILVGLYGVGFMSLRSGQNQTSGDPDTQLDARAPGGIPEIQAPGREPGTGQDSVTGGQSAPQAPSCEGGNCPGMIAPDSAKSAPPGAGVDAGGGPDTTVGSAGEGGGVAPGPQGQAQRRAGSPPVDSIAPGPVPIPGPAPAPNAAAGPGIIRTGEMEVRVRKGRFEDAWARAMNIAGKHGGFVAGSSADQVKGRLSRGTLTVRIPAANLDAAIADFQRLGRLVRLTSSSSDVSGQLVDFDARIRAAQARELQLLELLRQARSVSDSLQVGTALSEVRTEIESLQAQRANLQSQVQLAALTVYVYEPQAAPERPKPLEGRLSTAWDRALDAGSLTLSTIVIGAGFVLPLVVLGLIVWGGLRLRRRLALR